MSGTAATVGASRFTAFMNHPAGLTHINLNRLFKLNKVNRTQNYFLLGTFDEMVFGGCWIERPNSPS